MQRPSATHGKHFDSRTLGADPLPLWFQRDLLQSSVKVLARVTVGKSWVSPGEVLVSVELHINTACRCGCFFLDQLDCGDTHMIAPMEVLKAVDHVDHGAAFSAMKHQGASSHFEALLAVIADTSVIKVRLGRESTDDILLSRAPAGCLPNLFVVCCADDVVGAATIRAITSDIALEQTTYVLDRTPTGLAVLPKVKCQEMERLSSGRTTHSQHPRDMHSCCK